MTSKVLNVFMALIVILLSMFVIVTTNGGQLANAQDESQAESMQSMFESLRTRIEDDPEFLISVRFAIPPMDNDEVWWHLPYSSEDGQIFRTVGVIGSDYVCFIEQAGSAPINRCVPFSNIVSATWLEGF